jgi:hypothetical protein
MSYPCAFVGDHHPVYKKVGCLTKLRQKWKNPSIRGAVCALMLYAVLYVFIVLLAGGLLLFSYDMVRQHEIATRDGYNEWILDTSRWYNMACPAPPATQTDRLQSAVRWAEGCHNETNNVTMQAITTRDKIEFIAMQKTTAKLQAKFNFTNDWVSTSVRGHVTRMCMDVTGVLTREYRAIVIPLLFGLLAVCVLRTCGQSCWTKHIESITDAWTRAEEEDLLTPPLQPPPPQLPPRPTSIFIPHPTLTHRSVSHYASSSL